MYLQAFLDHSFQYRSFFSWRKTCRGALRFGIFTMICFLVVQEVSAQSYPIKLAHAEFEGTPTAVMANKLSEVYPERNIRVFAGGGYSSSSRIMMYEMAQGTLEMAVIPIEDMHIYFDKIKSLSQPFRFAKLDDVYEFQRTGEWESMVG